MRRSSVLKPSPSVRLPCCTSGIIFEDDDVYINWNTIHSLLRSIQSQNVSHYIGQVQPNKA
jgi:hypothetical protein